MSRTRRWVTVALCAAVTASAIIPAFIRAGDPGTAKVAAGRDMDVINAELKASGEKFRNAVPSIKMVGDAKFRKENADKVLPPLRKMTELLKEIAAMPEEPTAPMAGEQRFRMLGIAVGLGDKESAEILKAASNAGQAGISQDLAMVWNNWIKNTGNAAAQTQLLEDCSTALARDVDLTISAQSALALGNWLHASDDPKAQAKILEDYTLVAKGDPREDKIAGTLMIMSQLGAANEDLSKRAVAVIRNTLTGDAAQQVATQTASLDRPITLAGRTTTNTRFTSASLKGKVVLVDFWATWCGPCRAVLPGVKKLYATYHDKGLEILGVSCDFSDDKVIGFTKENDMPWVQLRELSQTEEDKWHPIATKYGVQGIPAMFLIDKKGILRYIDGEEDTEERIKKLLAETDAEPAKPAVVAPADTKK